MRGSLVVAMVVSCGKSEPAPTPAAPAPVPVVTAPRPTAVLSGPGFAAGDVLGQPRAKVDKMLGKATVLEDGPVSYDGFDHVAVTVLYDNDSAACISIVANGLNEAPENVDAALRWLHADRDRFVVEYTGEVDVWLPAMKERQQRRRESAKNLSGVLKPTGAVAVANGTDLEISAPPGQCDRGVLRNLGKTFKALDINLKELGFAMMECSGEENTTIVIK